MTSLQPGGVRRPHSSFHSSWKEFKRFFQLAEVWQPIEEQAFARQKATEEEASALYKDDPAKAEEFLTRYCHDIANKAVEAYWKLGDSFWSRYNTLF